MIIHREIFFIDINIIRMNYCSMKKILSILILILLIPTLIVAGLFFFTPSSMRFPEFDHSHFRMQYIFQGQAEDFGSPRYQVEYIKDACTGELPQQPIHFHDNRNQFVHLHWQKITGGQVLKFYGLNKIDFIDKYMGLRIDDILKGQFNPIPTHSNALPKPKDGDQFYVYTGKKSDFRKRDINDFVSQDLEKFFGVDSSIRKTLEEEKKTKINFLELSAKAHSGVEHTNKTEAEKHDEEVKESEKLKAEVNARNNQVTQNATPAPKTEEELKDINNLLGDILIFVQKEAPTDDQINARFDAMEPLTPSTCGG
jgi:hypothetical protein